MPEIKRPLKVFLCHAHSDKDDVRVLYERLVKDGVDAWLDKEKLLPGQDWELEIRKAVRASDVIVVCLSKQFNSAGFRQKEVRLALDTAMEKPEGEIFIIPGRLEVCENLASLNKWHWVDLFENDGYDKLLRALKARADNIGATLRVRRSLTPKNASLRVKFEKPIEEDKPAAAPPGEPPAKEADRDSGAKSPAPPSLTVRKPFRLKTEYVVAIIGAVATILAAVISSPLLDSWLTRTPAPTATVPAQDSVSPTRSLAISLPTETLSAAQPNPSPGLTLQPGSTIQHVVTTGESLIQIARCYGADFEKVRNANPQVSDPRNLSPGMRISVPNAGSSGEIYGPPCVTFYTVQSGDSWGSIAAKFNADAAVLMEANEAGALSIGRVLVIPSNSTLTFSIPSSLLLTLFKHEDDVLPNQDDCYDLSLLPGQVVYFQTTTSTDSVTHVVHNPNEAVVKDTDNLIIFGSPSSESSDYAYCIFNRSAATITYTLEVSLSQ
jgi:LysM repeat protein